MQSRMLTVNDFLVLLATIVGLAASTVRAGDWALLVASGANDRVLRYDQTGTPDQSPFIGPGSGGLNNPTGLELGPDGNLYVCSTDSNSILRYNMESEVIEIFALGNGLSAPRGLVFGPDANLYVSSTGSDAVIRFDGQSGTFLDTFVSSGSGGLDGPTGLVFGPDGNLYVSSWFSNQVLRYDGGTGAFIDSFATVCPTPTVYPENDDCPNAQDLSHPDGNPTVPVVLDFDVRCATDDIPFQSGCPGLPSPPIGHAIWYNYTAPCDGELVISMCDADGGGGDYDGIVVVHTGGGNECICPVDNSTRVACNDDFCAEGGMPRAELIVLEGICYTIRVGGWDNSTGAGTMVLSIACTGTQDVFNRVGTSNPLTIPRSTQGNSDFGHSDEVNGMSPALDEGPGSAAYRDAGLNAPQELRFGPDGNLYVASALGGNVKRFDGQSGAFIGTFIPIGSGGLEHPTGLRFGPDGALYVSEWLGGSLLKFDGQTGDFIGTFIAAGSGGLASPFGLLFWFPPAVPPEPIPDGSALSKTKFISFSVPAPATAGAEETALRVTFESLHHVDPPYTGGVSIPFTIFEGLSMWVGPPESYMESSATGVPFQAAQLQCAPHYQDWSTVGLLHVTGVAIVPSSAYGIENVSVSCQGTEATCAAVSSPLSLLTTRWGDVWSPYNPPDASIQPDITDVSKLVDKFRGAVGAPIKAQGMLAGEPGNPRGAITAPVLAVDFGFSHISACVDAYRGVPYPYKPGQCTGDIAKACAEEADCTAQATTGPCILCP